MVYACLGLFFFEGPSLHTPLLGPEDLNRDLDHWRVGGMAAASTGQESRVNGGREAALETKPP